MLCCDVVLLCACDFRGVLMCCGPYAHACVVPLPCCVCVYANACLFVYVWLCLCCDALSRDGVMRCVIACLRCVVLFVLCSWLYACLMLCGVVDATPFCVCAELCCASVTCIALFGVHCCD